MPIAMVHNPSAFIIGDGVRIASKTDRAANWGETWNSAMDQYIGQDGIVIRADPKQGFQVRTNDQQNFWYPSCSLAKIVGATRPMLTRAGVPVISNAALAAAGAPVPAPAKKKRVRVGAGPWDAAPCAHLRWHLMGFFREKLALVKTSVKVADGTEVTIAEVEVVCAKCNTKMTLQAK